MRKADADHVISLSSQLAAAAAVATDDDDDGGGDDDGDCVSHIQSARDGPATTVLLCLT